MLHLSEQQATALFRISQFYAGYSCPDMKKNWRHCDLIFFFNVSELILE